LGDCRRNTPSSAARQLVADLTGRVPGRHAAVCEDSATPPPEGNMTATTASPKGLHSGNPALSESLISSHLSVSAPRSLTVGGVSIKTLFLLAVLVAAGAWGWASAATPVGVDLGGGYA